MNRLSPPLATSPARRVWLFVLLLLWTCYGMTGRDAWQTEEARAFAAVLEWLEHGVIPLDAPLYTVLAGMTARLASPWLDWQDGARLASSLLTLAAMGFTAATARRLYGPGYGAIATLLLMGSFGLFLRVHALLPETALLAGYAALLYGLATARKHATAGWAMLLGAALLGLTRGLPDFLVAWAVAVAALALPGQATPAYRKALAGMLLGSLAVAGLWLVFLGMEGRVAAWWVVQAGWLSELTGPGKLLSSLAWFAWPAWPVAVWVVWHDHRRLQRENPLHLPLLATLATGLVGLIPAYSYDGMATPLVVPLTLLATLGIATLRRGAAQAFYWFGAVCVVFFALTFWVYFSAMEWGWPTGLAARMGRLSPTYLPQVEPLAVLLAALATLAWLVAVPFFPRAHARPALVWATGMLLLWLLLIGLFRPWAEQAWGYRPVAEAVTRQLPKGACVAVEVPAPAGVLLAYHLAHAQVQTGAACAWRLELGGTRAEERPGMTLVWQGVRPRIKKEVYRLYRTELDGARH